MGLHKYEKRKLIWGFILILIAIGLLYYSFNNSPACSLYRQVAGMGQTLTGLAALSCLLGSPLSLLFCAIGLVGLILIVKVIGERLRNYFGM